MGLRALRRDRAFNTGPELFLHERAFEDCLERLALVRRPFKSALLLGCPNPGWRSRLEAFAQSIEVVDPGPLFAKAADGTAIIEDRWVPPAQAFDLCLAIGTLDTVNDLPRALQSIRSSLAQDSLLIGAMAGGDGLPQLRRAMHLADQVAGGSSPHAHPRIEAASLAPLLTACGFVMPVVDVDRARVSYESLDGLVAGFTAHGRDQHPQSTLTNAAIAESPRCRDGRIPVGRRWRRGRSRPSKFCTSPPGLRRAESFRFSGLRGR